MKWLTVEDLKGHKELTDAMASALQDYGELTSKQESLLSKIEITKSGNVNRECQAVLDLATDMNDNPEDIAFELERGLGTLLESKNLFESSNDSPYDRFMQNKDNPTSEVLNDIIALMKRDNPTDEYNWLVGFTGNQRYADDLLDKLEGINEVRYVTPKAKLPVNEGFVKTALMTALAKLAPSKLIRDYATGVIASDALKSKYAKMIGINVDEDSFKGFLSRYSLGWIINKFASDIMGDKELGNKYSQYMEESKELKGVPTYEEFKKSMNERDYKNIIQGSW